MRRVLMLTLLVLSSVLPVSKAQDAKGCTDPAMFPNRIPGYVISRCDAGNTAHDFTWPGGKRQVLGRKTEVVYRSADMGSRAEPKFIAANYANALRKIGASFMMDPAKTTLGDRVLATVPIDGRDVWVWLGSDSGVVNNRWETYKLIIVAPDAAVQVITAQKMLDALNKDGFVTLYINFETGKWDVPASAQATLAEIVTLMRQQSHLKLSVEGHTDNVGQAAANKTLSENRARAVREALQAAGVPAARLKSQGFGAEKPVADNRSEDGRAKNRRVELVRF
ncbi:hypothetical protein IP84_13680 [beta proteobacterium AAP99]|nr:hypothetical protein IP84_13680 [beta proteobacterium AAP99]